MGSRFGPGAITRWRWPLSRSARPFTSRCVRTPPPRSEKNSVTSMTFKGSPLRKELAANAVARQSTLLGPRAERNRHAPATAPSPLGALRGPGGRNLRVAILSDFIRVPYANGAVFQTRFLYRQLRANGHEGALVAASEIGRAS